jgi:hypothetical protein
MPLVSYGRALTLHAERTPDAVALVHEGKTTRYAELDRAANRLARLFARRGVGEGDFVTLGLPNGREFVEALFACWKLGATPQPISPRLPRAERDAILALVAPKLVVDEPLDASGESDAPLPDRVSHYRMAICSGGSTGRPKVVVDHIRAECDPEARYHDQPPGTSILIPGPLYHSAPLINCLSVLLGGGKVVAMTRFDPAESLRLIEEHRLALGDLRSDHDGADLEAAPRRARGLRSLVARARRLEQRLPAGVAATRVDRVDRTRSGLGGLRRERADRRHADLGARVARAAGLGRPRQRRSQDQDRRARGRAASDGRDRGRVRHAPRRPGLDLSLPGRRAAATRRRLGDPRRHGLSRRRRLPVSRRSADGSRHHGRRERLSRPRSRGRSSRIRR